MSVQKINPDTYVGNTGKQLKEISNISALQTIINDLKMINTVYEAKYIYNGTGNRGYYELFKIGTTGGWAGKAITFLIQSYNTTLFAMGAIQYYNNATIGAKYITKTNYVSLYYKQNSDNTVSVYTDINHVYAPIFVKIISHSYIYDNPYPSGVPNAMDSLPSGLTEFGSL